MKINLSHFLLPIAILCAALWFALWLFAFTPKIKNVSNIENTPSLIVLPAVSNYLNILKSPTLFTKPSEEGFSGTFPEKYVNLPLTIKKPRRLIKWLERQTHSTPKIDSNQLMVEPLPPPQSALPIPEASDTTVQRSPSEINCFFSEELQKRNPNPEILLSMTNVTSSSTRVNLTVQKDGTVKHAFFDRPTKSITLLGAVRRLSFDPASETTTGWLDIRFCPTTGNKK